VTWIVSIFILFAISIGSGQTSPEEKKTIAILYFENNSTFQKEELDVLSKGLADMLITELSKIESLVIVERAQLQQILEEMKLGMTGVIDDKTAQQVGKILGVQHLLLGSFMNMFGDKLRIDARIVAVETGLTVKAEEETGKLNNLFDMVQKLTKKFTKDLDVKLTKQDKERLEGSENESLEAILLYSRGLEFYDQRKFEEALEMFQKALLINPDYKQAQEQIKRTKRRLRH
jgi:TolB-like protein